MFFAILSIDGCSVYSVRFGAKLAQNWHKGLAVLLASFFFKSRNPTAELNTIKSHYDTLTIRLYEI